MFSSNKRNMLDFLLLMEILQQKFSDGMEGTPEFIKEHTNYQPPKTDDKIKEVGDKVQLISPAYMVYFTDSDTGKQFKEGFESLEKFLDDNKICYDEHPIVVETGLDFKYKCGMCPSEHKHDMVVYYPSLNKKYITSQKDFKLVE